MPFPKLMATSLACTSYTSTPATPRMMVLSHLLPRRARDLDPVCTSRVVVHKYAMTALRPVVAGNFPISAAQRVLTRLLPYAGNLRCQYITAYLS